MIPSEIFFENSIHTKPLLHQIKNFGRLHHLFLLTGEKGLEKDNFAHIIHSCSSVAGGPFITIDCKAMNSVQWSEIFESTPDLLNEEGVTFYFKYASNIPAHNISEHFITYLATKLHNTNNNYILSYEYNIEKTGENPLIHAVVTNPNCLHLHIPPLRKRPDDIPNLVSLFVSELNAQLGTQLIGFSKNALKLLQQFSWNENLTQLQRVVKRLLTITKGLYVSEDTTAAVLADETSTNYKKHDFPIDLRQTLDDIENDIIEIVLEEENMNQSRAAQRLGISRSTLWKRMKTRQKTVFKTGKT
jgi:DNA-binding NtrC family response regulator